MGKQPGTYDFAKAGRNLRRIENADDRGNSTSESYQQHNAAGSPNVAGITLNNAVIDYIRKQSRQVQVCYGLQKGEHHNKHENRSIWFHESQQFDHISLFPFQLPIYRYLSRD